MTSSRAKTWTFLLLLILLLSPFLFSQMSGKIESVRLFEKDLVFLGEGRRGPYLLPDSLIIENSAKVFINSELQNRKSYQFNFIDGELRFLI